MTRTDSELITGSYPVEPFNPTVYVGAQEATVDLSVIANQMAAAPSSHHTEPHRIFAPDVRLISYAAIRTGTAAGQTLHLGFDERSLSGAAINGPDRSILYGLRRLRSWRYRLSDAIKTAGSIAEAVNGTGNPADQADRQQTNLPATAFRVRPSGWLDFVTDDNATLIVSGHGRPVPAAGKLRLPQGKSVIVLSSQSPNDSPSYEAWGMLRHIAANEDLSDPDVAERIASHLSVNPDRYGRTPDQLLAMVVDVDPLAYTRTRRQVGLLAGSIASAAATATLLTLGGIQRTEVNQQDKNLLFLLGCIGAIGLAAASYRFVRTALTNRRFNPLSLIPRQLRSSSFPLLPTDKQSVYRGR